MFQDPTARIVWSGYTLPVELFNTARERLSFILAVSRDRKVAPFFWISIMGGTGTGKSTIFNSLCKANLSVTGVERPKTRGPIAAFPKGKGNLNLSCFKTVGVKTASIEPVEGCPDELTIVEHRQPLPWIFVDSPDIDSLAREHHKMAENILLFSDFIIFVVSQEKYADERLNRFLRRIIDEGKEFIVVVNKATEELQMEDVLQVFKVQNLRVSEHDLVFIPFAQPRNGQLNHIREWEVLENRLQSRAGGERWKTIRDHENERIQLRVASACQELATMIENERKALRGLIAEINDLANRAVYEVLERHISAVREHTKTYIQPQIKSLYSRYDIFGKPRRAIWQAFSKIFEFFGIDLSDRDDDSKEGTLKRIEEQIDHSPIFHAVDFLVTEVLKRIPPEKKPIGEMVRSSEIVLSRNDIHNLMLDHSSKLFEWLEQEFEAMTKGIPKTKELGIYSSFALWGLFILGIEAALGGGISIVKAAVDAVIAPFITKATVDLFANNEIYRIVEELSERYRRGMEAIVFLQRDRFVSCVESCVPDESLTKTLDEYCHGGTTRTAMSQRN